MLKLIYHTAVFGPIDLEYDRAVVRVGRSEDNDLVLRHPSVEPHHSLLVFRGEKVLCLPASEAIPAQADLASLTGPELGAGDSIWIGDLQLSLAHSSRTVAVPGVHDQGLHDGALEAAGPRAKDNEVRQRRYYCAHCRRFVPEAEVKRVGLVGHAKRNLCPKCSRMLEAELEPEAPAPEPEPPLRQAAKRLLHVLF